METYTVKITATISSDEIVSDEELKEIVDVLSHDFNEAEFDTADIRIFANGKTFKASFNNVIGPATDSVIPNTRNKRITKEEL